MWLVNAGVETCPMLLAKQPQRITTVALVHFRLVFTFASFAPLR